MQSENYRKTNADLVFSRQLKQQITVCLDCKEHRIRHPASLCSQKRLQTVKRWLTSQEGNCLNLLVGRPPRRELDRSVSILGDTNV